MASRRDGEADFGLLARDTASPCVDNHPLLAAGEPQVRRDNAVCALDGAEIGLLSDKVTVTCQPRVNGCITANSRA